MQSPGPLLTQARSGVRGRLTQFSGPRVRRAGRRSFAERAKEFLRLSCSDAPYDAGNGREMIDEIVVTLENGDDREGVVSVQLAVEVVLGALLSFQGGKLPARQGGSPRCPRARREAELPSHVRSSAERRRRVSIRVRTCPRRFSTLPSASARSTRSSVSMRAPISSAARRSASPTCGSSRSCSARGEGSRRPL
jgi:hypothetical protein